MVYMLLLYWSVQVKPDEIVKRTLITEMDSTKMKNTKKIHIWKSSLTSENWTNQWFPSFKIGCTLHKDMQNTL